MRQLLSLLIISSDGYPILEFFVDGIGSYLSHTCRKSIHRLPKVLHLYFSFDISVFVYGIIFFQIPGNQINFKILPEYQSTATDLSVPKPYLQTLGFIYHSPSWTRNVLASINFLKDRIETITPSFWCKQTHTWVLSSVGLFSCHVVLELELLQRLILAPKLLIMTSKVLPSNICLEQQSICYYSEEVETELLHTLQGFLQLTLSLSVRVLNTNWDFTSWLPSTWLQEQHSIR